MKVKLILIAMIAAVCGAIWVVYQQFEEPMMDTYRRMTGQKAAAGKPISSKGEYEDIRRELSKTRDKAEKKLSIDSERNGVKYTTDYFINGDNLISADISAELNPEGTDKLLVTYYYRDGKPFDVTVSRYQAAAQDGQHGQVALAETEKETVVWQPDGSEFKHDAPKPVTLPGYAKCAGCYQEAQQLLQQKGQAQPAEAAAAGVQKAPADNSSKAYVNAVQARLKQWNARVAKTTGKDNVAALQTSGETGNFVKVGYDSAGQPILVTYSFNAGGRQHRFEYYLHNGKPIYALASTVALTADGSADTASYSRQQSIVLQDGKVVQEEIQDNLPPDFPIGKDNLDAEIARLLHAAQG